jgi:hypothetical protein
LYGIDIEDYAPDMVSAQRHWALHKWNLI